MPRIRIRVWSVAAVCALLAPALPGCSREEQRLEPRSLTWAELRVVRRGVLVEHPESAPREPYPAERLVDGSRVSLGERGLAWLRRDGGATLLVRGPGRFVLRARSLELAQGRAFLDAPAAAVSELVTPRGTLSLARVRASIDVDASGVTRVYVLSGEVRAGSSRARAGEELVLAANAAARVTPVAVWEDWTGGLATTEGAPSPAPFGVGTVGARRPGELGSPRFALAIQRMDVNVSIDGDFALTEVDQTFFNPTSETVEGAYAFRTPPGAVLQRFSVDRDGVIVFGRVQERAQARQQFQNNVYQGSTQDPALLEWDAPGSYRARLYPIAPGGARRVVVRYAEWLDRSGARRERRLYRFPMAAEGAEASLPHIEELKIAVDLGKARAKEVRSGMAGARVGSSLVVRAHDYVPRADLALELFDDGIEGQRAYRAPHRPDLETLPVAARDEAERRARDEADYVLVPLYAHDVPQPTGGLDLAIVVDTSAATDAASLGVARAAAAALLAHLGPEDRAVVVAADTGLRPVVPGWERLTRMDAGLRDRALERLATLERGGATDLGGALGAAAALLDAQRRGAVVYVGDGVPTVGELSLVALKERLRKLPRQPRVFALGVGDEANLGLLAGLARAGFAERIGDARQAAATALRVLEAAERPALLGVQIDLGPGVERVQPREASALGSDETLLVVGRLVKGKEPRGLTLKTPAGTRQLPFELEAIDDRGDLGRRWAEQRLMQMLADGEGRAALVDLGVRGGIVTPVTSFYVPTRSEMSPADLAELEKKKPEPEPERPRRMASKYEMEANAVTPTSAPAATAAAGSEKEGGRGVRAKGEEGAADGSKRYAVRGPADGEAVSEAQNFGMIGLLSAGEPASAPVPAASAAPLDRDSAPAKPDANLFADEIGGTLSGAGLGGGGLGLDHAAANRGVPVGGVVRPRALEGYSPENKAELNVGTGQGFGAGHGRLGGIGTIGAGADDGDALGSKRALRRGLGIHIQIGQLPHWALGCSAAADAPLEERVRLWRERLARAASHPVVIAALYQRALADCEAPSFRERARLLSLMLDALPTVATRVLLYRIMFQNAGARELLYAGILARIRTADERREFNAALGLKTLDPGYLRRLLAGLPELGARVTKLEALRREWPEDFAVALALLDALEDAGGGGAEELARALRARADADARVRTAIGELYLRLGTRAPKAEDKLAFELEARRAFGEIVEFAPEDPVARRRLGDLLLSHGYFADARRQYETLAALTPDDTSVALALAAAAEGQGLLEEALQWVEKAGAAGAPEALDGVSGSARALGLTYLARARAGAGGDQKERAALEDRARRLLSALRGGGAGAAGARVALSWSHPEFHPTLWTDAQGSLLPAPEGSAALGLAHAFLPAGSARLEVRLEPDELEHAARLGAVAELTVVSGELGPDERIARLPLRFERDGSATLAFSLVSGELRRD